MAAPGRRSYLPAFGTYGPAYQAFPHRAVKGDELPDASGEVLHQLSHTLQVAQSLLAGIQDQEHRFGGPQIMLDDIIDTGQDRRNVGRVVAYSGRA